MSETRLRVVKHQDFKKTIETVLGHSIKQDDIAVVSFDDKPLAEKVAAIDLTDFIFRMVTFNKENSITSKDVAIITQEDLANEEKNNVDNVSNTRNKFGKK